MKKKRTRGRQLRLAAPIGVDRVISLALSPRSRSPFKARHIPELIRQIAFADDEIKHRKASSPDDIRAEGWSVAIHNDYHLDGESYTFWLFTKGDRAVKGEGHTDAEALDAVRAALTRDECSRRNALMRSQPWRKQTRKR